MDIEQIQDFFLWCLLVNTGIYALTAIAFILFRDFVCMIHKKVFGLDEATVIKSTKSYLATYKLLMTFFNFVPWIAVLIIK